MRNGIVPVELPADIIAMIAAAVVAKPDIARPTVNLANGWVGIPDGRAWPFALEEEARTMLLEGLDGIELTLKRAGVAALGLSVAWGRYPTGDNIPA